MQFASINDLVTLHCSVNYSKHLPENIKIEWFDGTLPIKTAANGMTIEHTKMDTKLESLLIIDQVKDFHFGQYSCKLAGINVKANTLLLPNGKQTQTKIT